MKTTSEFVKKSLVKHKDKYNYEKTNYINSKTKVIIICPDHGEFLQLPSVHLRTNGCPSCGYDQRSQTRITGNNWWTYDQSREFIRSLRFSSIREWNMYIKGPNRPPQLPTSPKITYAKQWKGWADWLGRNNRMKEFLPYDEAAQIVKTFNIRSYEEWVVFCRSGKRPHNIPFAPHKVYNNWSGWANWLGYSSRANGELPGCIYILQSAGLPSDVYKIGRTYRLDERIKEHMRSTGLVFRIVATINVPNMTQAEQLAHTIANKYGLRYPHGRSKEYFRITNIHVVINEIQHQVFR